MTVSLLLWLQMNHYQQEQDKRAIILAQVVKNICACTKTAVHS